MGINRTNTNVSDYWEKIMQYNDDGSLSMLDGTDITLDMDGFELPFADTTGSIDPIAEGASALRWPKDKLPSDTVYEADLRESLNDLDGVVLSDEATGDFLRYNEDGDWVNSEILAGDIPSLPATILTSGVIDPARLSPNSFSNNQVLSIVDGVTEWVNASTTIAVQNEGVALTNNASTLNFTGAGVTASGNGSIKTIDIPAGGIAKYATGVAYAANDVIWNGDDDKIYVVDTAISAAANTQFSDVDTTELSPSASPGDDVQIGANLDLLLMESDGTLTAVDNGSDAVVIWNDATTELTYASQTTLHTIIGNANDTSTGLLTHVAQTIGGDKTLTGNTTIGNAVSDSHSITGDIDFENDGQFDWVTTNTGKTGVEWEMFHKKSTGTKTGDRIFVQHFLSSTTNGVRVNDPNTDNHFEVISRDNASALANDVPDLDFKWNVSSAVETGMTLGRESITRGGFENNGDHYDGLIIHTQGLAWGFHEDELDGNFIHGNLQADGVHGYGVTNEDNFYHFVGSHSHTDSSAFQHSLFGGTQKTGSAGSTFVEAGGMEIWIDTTRGGDSNNETSSHLRFTVANETNTDGAAATEILRVDKNGIDVTGAITSTGGATLGSDSTDVIEINGTFYADEQAQFRHTGAGAFTVKGEATFEQGLTVDGDIEMDGEKIELYIDSQIELANFAYDDSDIPFGIDIRHNIVNEAQDEVSQRYGGGDFWITNHDTNEADLKKWTEVQSRERDDVNHIHGKSLLVQEWDKLTWSLNTNNAANDYDDADRAFEVDSTRATFFGGLRLSGITGTGTHLTIDSNGDVTKTTISGGGSVTWNDGTNDLSGIDTAIAGTGITFTQGSGDDSNEVTISSTGGFDGVLDDNDNPVNFVADWTGNPDGTVQGIGSIIFRADDIADTPANQDYAKVTGTIQNPSSSNPRGSLALHALHNGSDWQGLALVGTTDTPRFEWNEPNGELVDWRFHRDLGTVATGVVSHSDTHAFWLRDAINFANSGTNYDLDHGETMYLRHAVHQTFLSADFNTHRAAGRWEWGGTYHLDSEGTPSTHQVVLGRFDGRDGGFEQESWSGVVATSPGALSGNYGFAIVNDGTGDNDDVVSTWRPDHFQLNGGDQDGSNQFVGSSNADSTDGAHTIVDFKGRARTGSGNDTYTDFGRFRVTKVGTADSNGQIDIQIKNGSDVQSRLRAQAEAVKIMSGDNDQQANFSEGDNWILTYAEIVNGGTIGTSGTTTGGARGRSYLAYTYTDDTTYYRVFKHADDSDTDFENDEQIWTTTIDDSSNVVIATKDYS